MNNFPKHDDHFVIAGPAGQIEVMTTYPKVESQKIAVICHPHPLYQGSMQNKVITTLTKAFDSLGLATLRFNFRGVGQSEGHFGNEVGELEDLRAVLRWSKEGWPNATYWLAGFSFGSYIAAKMAEEWPTRQLISIAPPVPRMDFAHLTKIHCPWLVVQGDADEVVSPEAVFAFAAHPPSPLTLIKMPGVSHFFHGKLLELRAVLMEALS